MKNTKKEYYKRLAAIQKEYAPEKGDIRKPYNWKKEWGPFIKYDADWDGTCLLQLILFKLEKMYIGLDTYSDEVRESLDLKLAKLREAIDLGKKVQTYKYDKECDEWSDAHCAHVIFIHKKGESVRSEPLHKIVHWFNEVKENSKDVNDRLEQYFARKEVQQWAKENGYNSKDISVSYGGEWDDEANREVWRRMLKKARKAEQADIDKFFKIIARNYPSWWW